MPTAWESVSLPTALAVGATLAVGGYLVGSLSKLNTKASETTPDINAGLHWDPQRERRGLGLVLHKANHIALIVSDVGRSAAFYSDVIGAQQIKRPNFDRHGAWFTLGNIELHLIKGQPPPPQGSNDLIVGHISLETFEIDRVPAILEANNITYRQNVSVPKGESKAGGGKSQLTNNSKDSNMIVKQYFFCDPDGYYVEVCNCDVLTKFCLNQKEGDLSYDEGVQPLTLLTSAIKMKRWASRARQAQSSQTGDKELFEQLSRRAGINGRNVLQETALHLGCKKVDSVDMTKVANLLQRRSIYGDMMQNFEENDIVYCLKVSGNDIPNCIRIMEIYTCDSQTFIPPAYFEDIDGDGVLDRVAAGTFKMDRKNMDMTKQKK